MYMNLKPNKHKRISFNTTNMASLGFIAPTPPKILGPPLNLAPPLNLIFCSGPPNYFALKFLGPRLKLGEGAGRGLLPCVRQSNIRRGKKLCFQLSHKHST